MHIVKQGVSIISEKPVHGSGVPTGDTAKPETVMDKCVSNNIRKIDGYKKFIELLREIPKDMNEIMTYFIQYVTNAAAQYILKRVQIVSLYIKKLICDIMRKIAEYTKEILQFCISGISGPQSSALITPIITLFNKTEKAAAAVMKGIGQVIDAIPPSVAVNAEGLMFYLTPKSMGNTRMKILNATESAVYRLPTEITGKINDIISEIDRLDIPRKVSAIAAGAAIGTAAVKSNSDINVSCPDMTLLNPVELLKKIEPIIKKLPIAEPLPKYENLSIDNIGFLVWLMTGFCPAGKISFGIPGQP